MADGRKIKRLLDAKGLTQREFSKLVGISESNISTIINHESNMRESTIKRICEILGCEPTDIM